MEAESEKLPYVTHADGTRTLDYNSVGMWIWECVHRKDNLPRALALYRRMPDKLSICLNTPWSALRELYFYCRLHQHDREAEEIRELGPRSKGLPIRFANEFRAALDDRVRSLVARN